MPNFTHGAIQANLIFELKLQLRERYRVVSEVSLATLPDGTTPDVLLYPIFDLDFIAEPAKRSDAPLLCVEIQSPSQSNEEMVGKVSVYFRFGVRSCWIVVPAMKGVFVYENPDQYRYFHGTETIIDPSVGVELPLTGIFA